MENSTFVNVSQPKKSNNKLYFFLAAALLIILIIIIVFSIFSNQSQNQSSSETSDNPVAADQFSYADISTKVSLNTETQNYITDNIAGMIEKFSKTARISINDIQVRNSSVFSNYDAATDITYGRFIVDIPVLKQSYYVQYEWSNNPDNTNFSGYPILVTCLRDQAQIIYPEFECKDLIDEGY